ncbi:hypothetical protein GS448_24490 [Rhodococcus hoagii]|nr:hypothetical protein [Prescottella equi]MBM4670096.1 hypothetical protein [Prescottella equi]NKV87445.1 hypothetical protein [Prescottella equi]
MTDTITVDEYRTAAKVNARLGFGGEAEICLAQASELEAESARETSVETLARALAENFTDSTRWDWLTVSRAAHAFFAADGRLLPEGGMVDVSKQVDGDLTEAELAQVAADLETIGTPPAVSAPLELPTEPGSRIRASVKRWGSALEWADTDPYVDTFTLGERDIWHAENDCLVVGAWNREYITVLEVLPAASVPDGGPDGTPEKPWPTWQDVPEGVRYWHGDGRPNPCLAYWVNQGGVRMHGDAALHEPIPSVIDDIDKFAPFVRVDGGKA